MVLAAYVSGHGFGHASRVAEVLRALRGRVPIHVRSEAPHWFFQQADPRAECSAAPIDVGMRQPNGLELDLPASLAAHERLLAEWDGSVRREADFLRGIGATAVLADIPPLACAAAQAARLPALALGNFSWDWILDFYAPAEPRWRPIVARYRAAYGLAEALLRLPLHGDFPAFGRFTDVPLVVARTRREPDDVFRALGLDAGDPRPLVLVSFGGMGTGPLAFHRPDALEPYRFCGFGPRPEGWRGHWTSLTTPLGFGHADLMAACQVVLGKPGYGLVAESIAHRTRFLYLARADFRETPVLIDSLHTLGCAREISHSDFFAGRWRDDLDALLEVPAEFSDAPTHGADVVADHVLKRMALL